MTTTRTYTETLDNTESATDDELRYWIAANKGTSAGSKRARKAMKDELKRRQATA